jgi:hypothetical protein
MAAHSFFLSLLASILIKIDAAALEISKPLPSMLVKRKGLVHQGVTE